MKDTNCQAVTLSKAIQKITASPTLALAAHAKQLKQQGVDVISLAVGEPDWDTFSVIKQAGIEAINQGLTKYTPVSGTPDLKTAICEFTYKDIGIKYDPSSVTVSTGAKFILFAALQSVLNAGDEVLLPAPYWVSYPEMIKLAGGVVKYIPTLEANQFKLQKKQLLKAITDKTKVLIINSPSNPTGSIYSPEDWKNLAEVLRMHPSLLVISDDIYKSLIFSNHCYKHLLEVAPDLKNQVLLVNGVSKSFSMTGWRCGWGMGPEHLIKAMSNYQSHSVSSACSISQAASVIALTKCSKEIEKSKALLKQRAECLETELLKLPKISFFKPEATFYIFLNIQYYLGKSFNDKVIQSSEDFCKGLLKDQALVTVPGSAFGAEAYLRLSFAVEEKVIKAAMQRLITFTNKLK
ncbi:MAG: pyridoxal phosphate-dependent aminotransferase [Bdellovibrionaceae bacterium]|nr:pyridoxal phosphate-dependent aminotransferase [Pseudobdellovibrionaceae bacterium]